MSMPPDNNCPDDELLQEVAAGIGSSELAQQTMSHVARCSTCAAVLRRYIKEFSDEQSPEDAAIIKQLQSSRPQWQKRLVRELVGGRRRFPWLKLVAATSVTAVAVFIAIASPTLMAKYELSKAQKNVAAAIMQRRTTEMRLTGVDYSPPKLFSNEMGPENGRSLDEVPAPLNDAIGAANKNLQAGKFSPGWFQVQGRSLMWLETPSSLEKAEKDFEKARSSDLDNASLEIDLAVSYYERDRRAEHPDLQRTLNVLNEVLSKPKLTNDDKASALFDLAIAYEKTQAWDLAVDTWEKYLQVDSSSGWATEARKHLQEAKQKTRRSSQVEEYGDSAIGWLVDALGKQDAGSREAVRKLGSALTSDHADPWLEDFLAALKPGDLPAITALSAALHLNTKGEHKDAITQAQKAAQIFARQKNHAGEYRALLEEIYAYRRALDGKACLARAGPLWSELSRTNYQWFKALLSLDKSECENLLGAFAESDGNLQASRQIAVQHDFPTFALRDIGFSAGNKHLRGSCNESWRESVDGLNVYWQKPQVTADRLYQFYSVMYQCALETGSLHAGEALLRHAIELRSSPEISKNLKIEGILHWQLANVLLARKALEEAEKEKQKAEQLLPLENLPPQIKLQLAEFQLEHGDAGAALQTLKDLSVAGSDVNIDPDHFFALGLNQTFGDTYLKLGEFDKSAVAYKKAIQVSESSLDKIGKWEARLSWLRATDESYRGLVRALIEQKKPTEALSSWELYRSRPMLQDPMAANNRRPGFSRLADENGSPALPQDKQETLPRITYANFKDGMHIWISQNGVTKSRWVQVERQDLENMARDFVEKCAVEDSNLADLQQTGARLFSLMLQPVMSELGPGGTVIIELDRQTYNLPMEALLSSDGKYFGEHYSLIYSPGIWMEKTLRAPRKINGQESLLLLDGSHSPTAGYLPGLDEVKTTLVGLFPRAQVINSAKTKWIKARPRLAGNEIFQYMGHGRPDGSGTMLDYDEITQLHAQDFSPDLTRNLTMVVLAACSGSAGRDNGLADTNSLIHAFLAGGVPSVIASRWNVDSLATSKLMISFYQHLARKETAAQAMSSARMDLLRAKPHPYFWAAFSLSGRAS
ncbi:MAG TPA: CHAT domain-containing protein [Candidatus Angelobacter sp.]|jgi:CHAT domain-containing protein